MSPTNTVNEANEFYEMMLILEHVNGVLPPDSLFDLDEDRKYNVIKIEKINTLFWDRILLESKEFQSFLPAPYARMSQDKISKMNEMEMFTLKLILMIYIHNK